MHDDTGSGIVLENLCQGYIKPFVCDIKLGFRTTYAWASEEYNMKNRCPLFKLCSSTLAV